MYIWLKFKIVKSKIWDIVKKLFFNTRSFGVDAYNSFKPKIKACNINFVSKDHLNRRILTQLSGIFFLIKLMISGKKSIY